MNNLHSACSAPIPSQSRKSHRRHSAEERANWVEMYERSEQTLKAFCAESGLAPSTLLLWRRQLRGPRGARRTRGALIEVSLPLHTASIPSHPQAQAAAALTIYVPNGLRIEVAVHTDARWVATLLSAVSSAESSG